MPGRIARNTVEKEEIVTITVEQNKGRNIYFASFKFTIII